MASHEGSFLLPSLKYGDISGHWWMFTSNLFTIPYFTHQKRVYSNHKSFYSNHYNNNNNHHHYRIEVSPHVTKLIWSWFFVFVFGVLLLTSILFHRWEECILGFLVGYFCNFGFYVVFAALMLAPPPPFLLTLSSFFGLKHGRLHHIWKTLSQRYQYKVKVLLTHHLYRSDIAVIVMSLAVFAFSSFVVHGIYSLFVVVSFNVMFLVVLFLLVAKNWKGRFSSVFEQEQDDAICPPPFSVTV
ncbi:hypothetical protein RFI_11796 [Reticulomyxa filosa]|uniref:Uncharacterized protein n=1 Tax=Reticulomyxa filosa TaxID=46433 RepID=X6NJ17_RETFI|nr:hypothetical protein RFI_11796 [Reticulomyxa filosa]|eukprot:ETO25342.1 hypothetical protein RFI_11796 [Reticulomyxa filosa]